MMVLGFSYRSTGQCFWFVIPTSWFLATAHAGADQGLLDGLTTMTTDVPRSNKVIGCETLNHLSLEMSIHSMFNSIRLFQNIFIIKPSGMTHVGLRPHVGFPGMLQSASLSSKRILRKICSGVAWPIKICTLKQVQGDWENVQKPGMYNLDLYDCIWTMCSPSYLIPTINCPCNSLSFKATSAADGCRDAEQLCLDDLQCPLATEMRKWLQTGHPERSFQRLVDQMFQR